MGALSRVGSVQGNAYLIQKSIRDDGGWVMKINKLLVAVLAVLFVGMAAWGQAVSTAQISGEVTDQTGAVVPDAQVAKALSSLPHLAGPFGPV